MHFIANTPFAVHLQFMNIQLCGNYFHYGQYICTLIIVCLAGVESEAGQGEQSSGNEIGRERGKTSTRSLSL